VHFRDFENIVHLLGVDVILKLLIDGKRQDFAMTGDAEHTASNSSSRHDLSAMYPRVKSELGLGVTIDGAAAFKFVYGEHSKTRLNVLESRMHANFGNLGFAKSGVFADQKS
jgi:hypothetical protein